MRLDCIDVFLLCLLQFWVHTWSQHRVTYIQTYNLSFILVWHHGSAIQDAGRTARCRYKFRHNGIVRFLWHSMGFLYRPTSATVQMLKLHHTVRCFSQPWRKLTAIAEDHGTRPKSRGKPRWSWIRDYLTALRNATTPTSTNFYIAVRTTRSIFIVRWCNVYL